MNAGQSARAIYAKTCALIILSYALIMCIVGFIDLGSITGLRQGLMLALVFSIPAALLLGGVPAILFYFHRRAFQGKVKNENDITSHPTRIVELDLPYQATFDLVMDSLLLLTLPPDVPGGIAPFGKMDWELDKTAAHRERGVILTRLRRRWNFYNTSRITIRLKTLDANTTQVHMQSQPNSPFLLFDYGLNLHNVTMMAQHLREEAYMINSGELLPDDEAEDIVLVEDEVATDQHVALR